MDLESQTGSQAKASQSFYLLLASSTHHRSHRERHGAAVVRGLERRHDLDAYLDSFFTEQTQHADLERYLYAPLAAFSANGGKRHRPLICMLAARAVGGDPARARSAAAAIEHFQSAALIHDDIADKGQLRRGKPCMYLTEGVGRAINCGDYDITLSTDAVLRDEALDAPLKLRVLGELTAMVR